MASCSIVYFFNMCSWECQLLYSPTHLSDIICNVTVAVVQPQLGIPLVDPPDSSRYASVEGPRWAFNTLFLNTILLVCAMPSFRSNPSLGRSRMKRVPISTFDPLYQSRDCLHHCSTTLDTPANPSKLSYPSVATGFSITTTGEAKSPLTSMQLLHSTTPTNHVGSTVTMGDSVTFCSWFQIRWWFVVKGKQRGLYELEGEWEQVKLQTARKPETCCEPAIMEPETDHKSVGNEGPIDHAMLQCQ